MNKKVNKLECLKNFLVIILDAEADTGPSYTGKKQARLTLQ